MRSELWIDDKLLSRLAAVGNSAFELASELFPLNRSITGDGLRTTIARLSKIVPLKITEIPSGTKVFDWTVPEEWTLEDAFIEDMSGYRIVDVTASNLHVVGYSEPIDQVMGLAELRPHLYSLPSYPDWIPYRTSYYAPNWGFCLTDQQLKSMVDGQYRVVIRSKRASGSLTVAEFIHAGEVEDTVLIFAHDCHPSLANDNLSGICVAILLAEFLRTQKTYFTYRFVFAPATIGSICWLAINEATLHHIRHGLVLSLLGDNGPLHYKETRTGQHTIDHASWHVLSTEFIGAKKINFMPWGYDERQFGSPGIDLPVGRITRTPNGEFPEYHTSADNLGFVSSSALAESWLACLKVLEALDFNRTFINLQAKGEPQLGRRGLYRNLGGFQEVPERQLALLWVLNQSDGSHSLLEIATRSKLPFHVIANAAFDLLKVDLLRLIA